MLFGPQDLRVEDVPEPHAADGEVMVEVQAATTCGTDVKMWRHGHRILPPYPCRFGHETAGVRADTGERVLVSDSVACGACDPCRAGRAQICRSPTWVLGGFAERIAAPAGALHRIPDGLPAEAAAMAEPLAAAVHAVARGTDAGDAGIIGGGPMGLMLTRSARGPGAVGDACRPACRATPGQAGNSAPEPRRASTAGTSSCSRPSAAPKPGARPPARPHPAASSSSSAAARAAPRSASRPDRSTTRNSSSGARSTTPPRRSTEALGALAADGHAVARAPRPDDLARGAPGRAQDAEPRPGEEVGCGSAELVGISLARRNSRCSTIRRESQMTSPSITSTGTRR